MLFVMAGKAHAASLVAHHQKLDFTYANTRTVVMRVMACGTLNLAIPQFQPRINTSRRIDAGIAGRPRYRYRMVIGKIHGPAHTGQSANIHKLCKRSKITDLVGTAGNHRRVACARSIKDGIDGTHTIVAAET